ncbi:Eco57I restriction-modification methylase domain-containing protein [Cetobacterium sp.]|uniref:HsdM family class I SAM-dependent methyltransferase n=1 Tax=Cetobacterium sp. TaxID=2071632 RepID=UPI003EE6AF1E
MQILEQESIIDKCQIFTPKKYATKLLDYVGYKKDLFGKKIIENSCGDGSILEVIVTRYIKSLEKNKSLEEIKYGLENDIYGIELDKKHYETCRANLDKLVLSYGIENVQWQIFNENTLKKKWDITFDYIVGNPPYISHKETDKKIREELQKKYKSCSKGKFDYCYAFIEESLKNLSPTGKFAYLIPNSIFKNIFGEELRKIILESLVKIIDYKSHRIFKNALTTSAIIVCNKKLIKKRYIDYFNVEENKKIKIEKEKLKIGKWIFEELDNNGSNFQRFGDYFITSMSVATLHNKSFIFSQYKEDDTYIYINENKIEKSILKKGASPLGLKTRRKEYIIFPYRYIDNKLYRFSEEEFAEQYPEAKKYLEGQKEQLSKRAACKSSKWFEYGRSQALHHLNREKLVLSSLITHKVEVFHLNSEYIPYSGIYIIPKDNASLETAKEILESENFFKYLKKIAKNANGKTLKISAKDIDNYYFKIER